MREKAATPWAWLVLLGLANYPALIGFWFVTSLATVRLTLEGEPAGRVGWVAAAPWALVPMLSPWVGRCVRYLGWRGACVCGYLALALSAAGMSVRSDFAWTLACVSMAGAGLTFIWIVPDGWAAAMTPPDRMGRMVGWFETLAGTAIGVGPALLAWTGVETVATEVVGLGLPFLAASLVLFVRPAPRPGVATGDKVKRGIEMPWAIGVAGTLCLLGGAMEGGGGTLLPVLGLMVGLSEHEAPLLMTGANLAQLGMQLPLGWAADRWGARRLLVLTFTFCLGGGLGLALFRGGMGLGGAAVILGMGTGALYSLGRVIALKEGQHDVVKLGVRLAALYTFGVLVGAPALGGMLTLAGPAGFGAVIAACAVAVLFCSLRVRHA